ncbi:hypothetical protein [Streptomyces sp. NPDC055632]
MTTHLPIMESDRWSASVEAFTPDLGLPLASVDLGDYASRTEAARETAHRDGRVDGCAPRGRAAARRLPEQAAHSAAR